MNSAAIFDGLSRAFSPASLDRLGPVRAQSLRALGFDSLQSLVAHPPFRAARMMLGALASGTQIELNELVEPGFRTQPLAQAPGWPLAALSGLDPQLAQGLARLGLNDLATLEDFLREVESDILRMARLQSGFSERPSAPPELLPQMIGAIASHVGFSSFITDSAISGLALRSDSQVAIDAPISGKVTDGAARNSADELLAQIEAHITRRGIDKLLSDLGATATSKEFLAKLRGKAPVAQQPSPGLGQIFDNLRAPEINLGYIVGHRQKWINLGTALGEVKHSVTLAAGETRNLSRVNFLRRSVLGRSENTETGESLSNTVVQTRAIEEITSAVAREHQAGGTTTEAATSATAVSMVASLAVGASVGATIGTVVAPGIGTAVGAALGAGVSGGLSAGFSASSAQALGNLRTDTSGERALLAELQQNIQMMTSQTASASRSLWSTVVIEDSQAETVEASTTVVTNYNHMHALNLVHFEMLQHYLVTVEPETVQPFMLLPHTFLDLTGFQFIRDYWELVRPWIEDEGLAAQGDAYFVDEGLPSAPDLLPEPPEPTAPDAIVSGLRIRIDWTREGAATQSIALRLFARDGTVEVEGREAPPGGANTVSSDEGASVVSRFFEFPELSVFDQLPLILEMDRNFSGRIGFGLMVLDAEVSGNGRRFVVTNQPIGQLTFGNNERQGRHRLVWDMPDVSSLADRRYAAELRQWQRVQIINAQRQAAFDALQADLERFRNRLERHMLRRRFQITRAILAGIEPEELIALIRSVRISVATASGAAATGVPLSEIADPMPIGFAPGAIVLRLRRLGPTQVSALVARHDIPPVGRAPLEALLGYAEQTHEYFETRREKDPIVAAEQIYVPTGGLFLEALLGRANSAEYLEMERHFDWHETPIPNAAPGIADVGLESRALQREISVTNPEGNLTILSPQSLPDPGVATQAVLGAIQNGALFRDMSKSEELAQVVGGLSTLSGQIAQAASEMTGTAQAQALKLSSDLARAALNAAKPVAAPKTMTQKRQELGQADKLDDEAKSGQQRPIAVPPKPLKSDVFRAQVGLPPESPLITDALFSFIFNKVRGTDLAQAFQLQLRKEGLIGVNEFGEQTSLPATEPRNFRLDFSEIGPAQIQLSFTNNDSPFLFSLRGLASTFGVDIELGLERALRLPNNQTHYVFELDFESEVIEVSAATHIEAKATLEAALKAALQIGGDDDDNGDVDDASGTAGELLSRLSKVPSVVAVLKNAPRMLNIVGLILTLVQEILPGISGSAAASGSVGASGSVSGSLDISGKFAFRIPTGALKLSHLP